MSMEKTMYIPKGQECRFEDLTCERIIVNGNLHVDGRLKAKHICGKGFVYAKWITARTVNADTVDADSIAADTLAAAHVNAFDVNAAQSMAVSSLITADYVRAGHFTYAGAEIRDLQADEAIKLPPGRRGLLRTLFSSFVRTNWAVLTHWAQSAETARCPECTEPQAPTGQANAIGPELEEAARLMNDPEFLRIRAMYRLTQKTGDIWQIVPKAAPTGRSVTAFTAA